jgi:hypothetical protein
MSKAVAWVNIDDRPFEWRMVRDQRGFAPLVDAIMTEPAVNRPNWVHGLRTIIVGELHDPASYDGPILIVVVDQGYGAAYLRETRDGMLNGKVTKNPHPVLDPPVLAFSNQGWNSFPKDSIITQEELRTLVFEFLETGQCPTGVDWQESEFIQ